MNNDIIMHIFIQWLRHRNALDDWLEDTIYSLENNNIAVRTVEEVAKHIYLSPADAIKGAFPINEIQHKFGRNWRDVNRDWEVYLKTTLILHKI